MMKKSQVCACYISFLSALPLSCGISIPKPFPKYNLQFLPVGYERRGEAKDLKREIGSNNYNDDTRGKFVYLKIQKYEKAFMFVLIKNNRIIL